MNPLSLDRDGVLSFYEQVIGSNPIDICESKEGVKVLGYDTGNLGVPFTAATCGMSARRMNAPDKPGVCRRAELIAYLPSLDHPYVWWLSWLAEFPFIDDTWLDYGHTVRGSEALFPGSQLRHFIVLPSLVRQHDGMERSVRIDGEPVHLWWVVPITDSELELKRVSGVDALLEAFDEQRVPLVVDPKRSPVV